MQLRHLKTLQPANDQIARITALCWSPNNRYARRRLSISILMSVDSLVFHDQRHFSSSNVHLCKTTIFRADEKCLQKTCSSYRRSCRTSLRRIRREERQIFDETGLSHTNIGLFLQSRQRDLSLFCLAQANHQFCAS